MTCSMLSAIIAALRGDEENPKIAIGEKAVKAPRWGAGFGEASICGSNFFKYP